MPPERSHQSDTYIEILVLSLFALGGEDRAIDTEHVAMKAAELAPGRFRWRHYPAQVSLDAVRRNLMHAKKAENGAMVAGSSSRGWHLTPEGTAWASANRERLSGVIEGRSGHDKEVARRRNLAKGRIFDLPAWSKHLAGEEISRQDAESVFRLSDYVVGDQRRLLIDRGLTALADDAQVGDFMRKMAEIAGEPTQETP